jgi:general secretion pathway protein F
MPVFAYKAVSGTGEVVEDRIEAADEQSVIRQLQDMGHVPIRVAPAKGAGSSWLTLGRSGARRLSQKDVAIFTQDLATLLHAGLPLDRSLEVFMDLSEDPRLEHLAGGVLEKVRGGAALSGALEAQVGVFSRFYLNMIRAGEAGGALEAVLQRLAEYLERAKELRDSVISALIYPAILVTLALVSVFVLLAFVVPQFEQLFEGAGRALPLPTQIVMGTADFLAAYWWALLLGVAAVVLYMRRQLNDPVKRYTWDARFLRLPLAGELIRKMEVARFARTLGTLLGNGVPLLGALSVVKETLSNRVLAEGVEVAAASLKEGQGMAEPLLATGLFPKLGMQMIKLGEETGRLDEMLMRAADTYDREVRLSIQRMLTLLEPVLIVGLGVVIAGIIMSILVAILSVNELAF